MTVNGDLVGTYTTFVTHAMVAFLPLMGAIIGLFLAFAVANSVRFLIMKMK
jgi:hypothetical protein